MPPDEPKSADEPPPSCAILQAEMIQLEPPFVWVPFGSSKRAKT